MKPNLPLWVAHCMRMGPRRVVVYGVTLCLAVVLLGAGVWFVHNLIMEQSVAAQPALQPQATAEAPGQATPRLPNSRGGDGSVVPPAGTRVPGQGRRGAASETVVPDVSVVDTPTSASSRASIVVVAGIHGVTVWGIDGGKVSDMLPAGTVLSAQARTADSTWLQVEGHGGPGWVAAADVIGFDIGKLATATLPEALLVPASSVPNVRHSPEMQSPFGQSDNPVAAEPSAVPTEAAPSASLEAGPSISKPDSPRPADMVLASVVLTDSRLNIRSGPGTQFVVVDKAYPGDVYRAVGRNEGADWIQVRLPGTVAGRGWMAAEFVAVNVAVTELPVVAADSQTLVPVQAYLVGSDAMQSLPAGVGSQEIAANTETPDSQTAAGLEGVLVFETSNGGLIFAYNLQTGVLLPLTYGFDPAISPDGSTVAFTRDGGEHGLYLIDIDGRNERLIFSGRAKLASPKWDPDGNWILFSRGDEFAECYRLGFRGCVPADKLDGDIPDDAPLVREQKWNLAVVDRNGSNYHDVAALESARAPDWTDAGIVYQSDAGLQITADVPNAENRLVIFDYLKPFYHDPDWQPDGRRIAYQGKEASHWEIFAVNPDGTELFPLTKPETVLVDVLPSNVAPVWSPDGQHIAFLSNREPDNEAGRWRIWVMDADGANQRPLDVGVELNYGFGDEQMVSWGPE